jgi:hypothetical protein
LEDTGVDGRLILQWILKKLVWKGINWIDLAQDMDKWWALVDAVLKLREKHTLGRT